MFSKTLVLKRQLLTSQERQKRFFPLLCLHKSSCAYNRIKQKMADNPCSNWLGSLSNKLFPATRKYTTGHSSSQWKASSRVPSLLVAFTLPLFHVLQQEFLIQSQDWSFIPQLTPCNAQR